MSARFDGSADVLSIAAAAMSGSAVTFAARVFIDVDRDTYSMIIAAINGAGDQWLTLNLDADGTTLVASTPASTINGPSLSVSGWYYVALVHDPAGTDFLYVGLDSAAALTQVSGALGNGVTDGWTITLGNDAFAEWLNGREAHARIWTGALSAAELAAERFAPTPARTANLWASWPLVADPNDTSGNARNLTAAGTVTYVGTPWFGTAAGTWPAWVGSATGQVADQATASGVWPAWTGTATGQVERSGTAAGVWPAWIGAADVVPWPRAVAANNRLLVDQFGDPWFGVGDTVWSIVGSLTNAQILQYLDNRAAKGVNFLLLSMPEAWYVANPPDNVDGEPPFTGVAFQTPPNEPYWVRFDFMVAAARARGITLLVCPFYLGFAGSNDGWSAAVEAATDGDMRDYADFLHARYGTAPNIMWIIGHDRVPNATQQTRALAYLDQLINVQGNSQLFTYGGIHDRDVGGTDTFGFGTEDWAAVAATFPPTFDTQYDYSEWIASNAYFMWDLAPVRPFIFLEGKYEEEQGVGIGAMLLREQMYAARAAGACAVLWGNNPIWNFENNNLFPYTFGWVASMDLEGSVHLSIFADIVTELGDDWAATTADSTSTYVTAQGSGSGRIAARYSATYGEIYTTGTVDLTVDLTEHSGSAVDVRVIDPTTGSITDVGTYPTSAPQTFPWPGNNADGAPDWGWIITPSDAGEVEGVGAGVWPAWTGTATGQVTHTGTAAGTWPAWSGAAAGTVEQQATAAGTWPAWIGSAIADTVATGTATGDWPTWTAAAIGTVERSATAAGAWPAWTATAAGTVEHTATAAGVWPAWSGTAFGVVGDDATGHGFWPAWIGTAVGTVEQNAAAAGVWPTWLATALGTVEHTATGAGTWPTWTGSAAGAVQSIGTAAGVWPAWIGAAFGIIGDEAPFIIGSVLIDVAGLTVIVEVS